MTSPALDARNVDRGDAVDVSIVCGGRRVEATNGVRYSIVNPASGDVVGTAALASADDATRVVEDAQAALPGWRETPARHRADRLAAAIDGVAAQAPELSVLLTREQGKPLAESRAEVASFLNRMRTFVRLAHSTSDGRIPVLPGPRRSGARPVTEPRTGVTVGLVAWNFPIGLMAKEMGPALLAGGTVIVKPASTTPLAAMRVIELMQAAGLPPGVVNGITGRGDEVGAALVAHPAVARVHLTGSDATGNQVRHAAERTGSELLLELAGSDPMIVCADADLPQAVRAAVVGRFRNAGQACTAVKRLYVAAEIYDAFVRELCAQVRLLEPGDGLTPAEPPRVRIGPVHTAAQRARLVEQLDDALRRDARVLVGGRVTQPPGCGRGYFLEPTVVEHGSGPGRLLDEEVFGPVLPVVRTRGLDDAIELANRSHWDLNASVWTSDRASARRAAPRIRCRRFWINRLPFGSGLDI